MSYALIEDVPASWEWYAAIERSIADPPPGLLIHVAGPTDEGIRIIEVWESEAAWRQHAADLDAALASVDPFVAPRVVIRGFRPASLVMRTAGQAMAAVEQPAGRLDDA